MLVEPLESNGEVVLHEGEDRPKELSKRQNSEGVVLPEVEDRLKEFVKL